jgi:ABC-2 type transport system ATP-binding protein
LRDITKVTRRFYDAWDEEAYRLNLARFGLSEDKTPRQLSAGMKVKYSLTLALSHKAELLLLDEPTSGLDPVSRAELLDVFLTLSDEGVTILFSTHITSDLDQCADGITYIRQGKIIASEAMKSFIGRYRALELAQTPSGELEPRLIGLRRVRDGYTALIRRENAGTLPAREATLEDIMVHFEREANP